MTEWNLYTHVGAEGVMDNKLAFCIGDLGVFHYAILFLLDANVLEKLP